MDRADLLVLQYPMWWHLPPAMLKGWFDRVLVYGETYTSRKRFENGRFVGKRAMLSVTVGTSPDTYAHDGRSGDIDLMLWPVNFSLAYVGYEVVAPFVAYGVEAGLRYSDPAADRGAAQGHHGRPLRHAAARRRTCDDPFQPHGRVGSGWPDRAGRTGPLAVRPSQAAPRAGVTAPGSGPANPDALTIAHIHGRCSGCNRGGVNVLLQRSTLSLRGWRCASCRCVRPTRTSRG